MSETTADPAPPPPDPNDPNAIFVENGPFPPLLIEEAIRTVIRTLPLDQAEPRPWSCGTMHCALTALAAFHPRDEIEIMLSVQALAAYHAAAANWRLGMNLKKPNGDSTHHISTAANAARNFDALLKSIERRQAKPIAVRPGRPAPKIWPKTDPVAVMERFENRCRTIPSDQEPAPKVTWTPEDLAIAEAHMQKRRIDKGNEGLAIANTEGILPEEPTPRREAYMGRRLALMYRREYEESLRNGVKKIPKIRAIGTGDLIP
jgi:hypothetical protein